MEVYNVIKTYYEKVNRKSNFIVILRDSKIIDLLRTTTNNKSILGGELIKTSNETILNVETQLLTGKTKFAEIDRKYKPKFGLPLEETDTIEFILRKSLFPQLENKGYLSDLP